MKQKPSNFWSESDKVELIKNLSVVIKGQATYGQVSISDSYEFFKHKLEKKYSVDQIIRALDLYTDRNRGIPVPADINNILDPEKPKITQSEYVNAKKWQEQNQNYSAYTPEAILIKSFEKQQEEDRAPLHLQPIHPSITARMQEEKQAINPPAPEQKTDEDTPIMWDDLDEEHRQKIRDKVINFSPKARESYLRSYGAPSDEIENQKGKP